MTDNVGKSSYPAVQASAAFSQAFPVPLHPLADTSMPCLIPCAIDQDAYFRLTRDVAPKLGYPKPSLLHCKFFPPLQGRGGKMSGSLANTAVYVTDTPKQVRPAPNCLLPALCCQQLAATVRSSAELFVTQRRALTRCDAGLADQGQDQQARLQRRTGDPRAAGPLLYSTVCILS